MITVTEHAIHAIGFTTPSAIAAVQTARELMSDGDVVNPAKGAVLINKLLGLNLTAKDLLTDMPDEKYAGHWELMVAQGVAETVVKNVGVPLDEAEVLSNARARAKRLCLNPMNQCWFAKPEATEMSTEQVIVASGIETKVAVKADGSIKKGGKEVLAIELYKKYVAELNGAPYSNQAFIAILVAQLGMTKAGATTYNYNMKKKHGGVIEAKGKTA